MRDAITRADDRWLVASLAVLVLAIALRRCAGSTSSRRRTDRVPRGVHRPPDRLLLQQRASGQSGRGGTGRGDRAARAGLPRDRCRHRGGRARLRLPRRRVAAPAPRAVAAARDVAPANALVPRRDRHRHRRSRDRPAHGSANGRPACFSLRCRSSPTRLRLPPRPRRDESHRRLTTARTPRPAALALPSASLVAHCSVSRSGS